MEPKIKTAVPGPVSREYWAEREKYVAHGVSNSTQIFADYAEGALVRDVDGNVFVDFAAGIGVINIGHRPQEIVDAIGTQINRFIHTSINVLWYDVYTKLARKLCELAPLNEAKTMFVNSGAEAVENAVKIAKKYTGRTGIVTVDGSFHGRTLLTMSLTTKVKPYKDGFGPFAPETYKIPCPNLYRRPDGVSADVFAVSCADAFENMLNTSLSPDMIACVILEPVQGEGGFVPMPPVYVRRMREITARHGITLIMDEIQSGIARTGTFFATEQFGIEPDIITSSKSLAAGLPLGAVIGKTKIMDSVHTGGIGGTFGGNPVACAAALAVIDNISKYNLCAEAVRIGEYITKRCRTMQKEYEQIGDVRGMGAMIGMEFVKADKSPDKELTSRVINESLQKGAIFINTGIHSNVIRFLPPLVMTDAQLKLGMDILESSIGKCIRQ
jgi:4-aminobutyrate aminotransferase/(S)-3-amino-2-methylpropionate transaminase